MTILFESDWSLHPTADIDLTTSNQSFIHLAQIYKKLGVKNHAFPLALYNQNLRGVNPFDPDLDEIMIGQIALECADNAWYFFREIARTGDQNGLGGMPAQANRANFSMWWSFFNHIFYTLIQPRQTGKSISADWLTIYLMYIKCRKTNINLMTKDDGLRRKNIERLKEIAEELPFYLNLKRFDDTNNGEEITVNALGNSFNTHVPQASPKRALLMGRGFTTPVVLGDEGPFQANIGLALPAMLASRGAAVENAKAAGAPYGVLMTTTAGKKDDRDGKWFYQNIILASAPWSERFLDARNQQELEEIVRANAPGGKIQILGSFDHRQLGKTDEWLRARIEEALQEGEDAERDYLNRWTAGNEKSPFKPNVTEMIAGGRREPYYEEIFPERYILRWYIEESDIEQRMANGKFILGADTSEAMGKDDICLCLIDVESGETIAAGNYNETNLIKMSMWVAKFLVRFENVTFIPERRSTGILFIDQLTTILPQYGMDPFKRIFNRIVNDKDESDLAMERYQEIRTPMTRRTEQFYEQRKQYFGFATSGSGLFSRGGLYSTTLNNAASRMGDKARDPLLVDQMLGLVNKNGRIDHEDGAHDDMVIAWLLAHWLMTQGRHLQYYGIDIRNVMADVGLRKPETPQEAVFRMEQDEIRREIEELYNQLTDEEDEYVAARLEQKLRNLDRRIVVEDGEIYSLDELFRSAKDSKRQRVRRALVNEYEPMYRQLAPSAGSYAKPPSPGLDDFGGYNNVWG